MQQCANTSSIRTACEQVFATQELFEEIFLHVYDPPGPAEDQSATEACVQPDIQQEAYGDTVLTAAANLVRPRRVCKHWDLRLRNAASLQRLMECRANPDLEFWRQQTIKPILMTIAGAMFQRYLVFVRRPSLAKGNRGWALHELIDQPTVSSIEDFDRKVCRVRDTLFCRPPPQWLDVHRAEPMGAGYRADNPLRTVHKASGFTLGDVVRIYNEAKRDHNLERIVIRSIDNTIYETLPDAEVWE